MMSSRAQEVRAIQLAISLELASYEPHSEAWEFASRRGFSRQLAGVIAHTIDSALIRGQLLSKDELPHSRHFSEELGKWKGGSPSEYDSVRAIDRQLVRAIQATMSMLHVWIDWSEKTYAREYRQEAEVRAKQRREEKLMRRRITRIERVLEAGPTKPPKKCKKIKHEAGPMCEKCHKRPVAKDNLCTPCFAWEKNKLGRA